MGIIEPTQGATGGGGTVLSPPRLIKSITTSSPPVSPSAGDAYIIPIGATGAWSGKDNDIAQWSGAAWTYLDPAESWFAYVDDEDNYYLYTGAAWVQISVSGAPGAHASTHELSGSDVVSLLGLSWGEAQAYYVGKHGHDTNYDGKAPNAPFFTIGAAVTAVNAQSPATGNRFIIHVLDAGIYDEAVYVPAYTLLYAPAATFTKNVIFNSVTNAGVVLHASESTVDGVTASGSSKIFTKVDHIITLTGKKAFSTSGGNIDIGIDVGSIEALGSGKAINNTAGQIYGRIGKVTAVDGIPISCLGGSVDLAMDDFALTGTGAYGIYTGSGSSARLRIGKMVGPGASGTALRFASGVNSVYVGEISGFTGAYSVSSAADMYLIAGKLDGTRTNTSSGTVNVTTAGIPPTHAASHENGGADEISVAGLSGTLADAQTPSSHASSHQPGGGDVMAVDAAAGTGSLRTLGTGAQQATAGNDSRLSDSRTPSGAAGGDLSGTYPNPAVDDVTLNPAPTSDRTANGLKTTDTVGENVAFGDLLYMKSDGKYWKADADQASLMPGVVMALETILADAAGALLHKGYVRYDTWNWTPGDILHAGNTAGAIQQPAPSGSGDQVQIVGYAITADIIFFNPQLVMVEVV